MAQVLGQNGSIFENRLKIDSIFGRFLGQKIDQKSVYFGQKSIILTGARADFGQILLR